MFCHRRFHRQFTLLSIAMSCFFAGYILGVWYEYTVPFRISKQELKHSPNLIRIFKVNHNLKRVSIQSDADKLARIAQLLRPADDAHNDGEYKQIQNRILQIEKVLKRFGTNYHEARTNNAGLDLTSLSNTLSIKQNGTEQLEIVKSTIHENTAKTPKPRQHHDSKSGILSILENIEDLLEQPPFPAPLIENVKLGSKPYMNNLHYNPSVCTKTGMKLAANSLWFKARYIPDIKIFLDREDINNFTNYYKLSHYGLPFGVKGQDRRLMARLLNNPNFTNPNIYVSERPTCVRCAVVGLGGVLNGSNMGKTIDAHDYVFRLNRALTKGRFAQDVGTRTSFYTFFPESQYTKEIEDPTVMSLYVLYRPYDVTYAMAMLSNDTPPLHTYDKGQTYWMPSKPKLDVRKLKIIHPDFMRYVFTRFLDSKAYRPTTGALVVFLAVHLCDEINMYGFGYDPRFPMHYYDTKKVELTRAAVGSHDVDNERKLWRKLMTENVLYLYNRTEV